MAACKLSEKQIRKLETFVETILRYEIKIETNIAYSKCQMKENSILKSLLIQDRITSLEQSVLQVDFEVRSSFDYPIEEEKYTNVRYDRLEDKFIKEDVIDIEGVKRNAKESNNNYESRVRKLQKQADLKIIQNTARKLNITTRFLSLVLEIIEMKMILEERFSIIEAIYMKNSEKFEVVS